MFATFPWKMIVRRTARAYGIGDPALWLARIRNFSQPSEVQEPIELLRAGVHFHARGLINTKAIQHNMDWVWPYWVERQFDPADHSFIPRAFSFSHINLTHRNWTAVGLPGMALYPLVDPRGLVTPLYDGWSLDFWLTDSMNQMLLPSRTRDESVDQKLVMNGHLAVETTLQQSSLQLQQRTEVVLEDNLPVLQISVCARSPGGGTLAMAIRPYNPEGVQFIDRVERLSDHRGWLVNNSAQVLSDRSADRILTSHYDDGDLFHRIASGNDDSTESVVCEDCDQGMATAASLFDFTDDEFHLSIRVPLDIDLRTQTRPERFDPVPTWTSVLADAASLALPDSRLQYLYETSLHTLVLLSADDIVPGPYTYRRFWFRDACLMINSLIAIGLPERCRQVIERLPERQQRSGYFRSQNGEWDSNGQVLWMLNRYRLCTHKPLSKAVYGTLERAVDWIDHKRVSPGSSLPHAGLLPAGFSAEHLGPNDNYYWDDLWSEAGLRSVAQIWRDTGDIAKATKAEALAGEIRHAIEQSLGKLSDAQTRGGFPASPYRRMDAGAIGSLVSDYPLQLTPPNDPRITATIDHIMQKHFYRGGFFQDLIHSGINAYLTLDIAQTLLRYGDSRWRDLLQAVAAIASPTGQWPEAIHPQTLGGCMGDGQHGWAAAEWVMMIRNCFVREEPDHLVVGSGLFPEWFAQDSDFAFGPTLTAWGRLSVRVIEPASAPKMIVDAHWHGPAPRLDVCVPGFHWIRNAVITSAIPLHTDTTGASCPANLRKSQTIPMNGDRR